MSTNNLHGGDLDEISRIYNINKSDIINFSGNVNPLGLPESVKKAIADNTDICTNYPDVSYLELRNAIKEYTGANIDNIIVGNGSTELISCFIKYVKPKKAVIVSPAYSEYLKEIKAAGGEALLFELTKNEEFMLNTDKLINTLDSYVDLLVICNPNNPTGTYITESEICKILNCCKANNIKLMIDETYVEFSDKDAKVSAIPLAADYNNLFIVRGTSKFFACPGLRLGYGICSDKATVEYINSHKDLWSVNVFAELAGKIMFTDSKFINSTLNLINSEREKFIKELGVLKGLKLYTSQSNFFLAEILKEDITSDYIFNRLIKKGILIRNCADFPYLSNRFIRFCILDKNNNTLLIENLREVLN